ncbi:hypothetical protein [Acinetobacter ursingii]|uniref:hypothetical protein n=1 Tax=Acinetobacter ursingii TaxID=108980 RepID=UPI003009A9FC
MKRIILGLIFCGVTSVGFANSDTVFGIKLGENITKQNIPPCSKEIFNQTCYVDEGKFAYIHLTKEESPKYVKNNILMLGQIDGKVEMIYFRTNGFDDDINMLLTLTEKFGKYKSLNQLYTPHKTRNGSKITSSYAVWQIPDKDLKNIYINLNGVSVDDVDTGTVKINTEKYKNMLDKEDALKKANERKL